MATLQKSDFEKVSSKGSYQGLSRKQIVFKKIADNKPFIIGKNSKGESVVGVKYVCKNKNGWPASLIYVLPNEKKTRKNYKEINLNKIFKDPDFGGGGGSGGGSDNTAYVESLQCFYCSLVFNVLGRKIEEDDFDKQTSQLEGLKKAAKWCNTTHNLLDCQKNVPVSWINDSVFVKIANKLFDKYKNKFKGNVYFHRGSDFMNNLYKAKKDVHKRDKKSEYPQAPGTFADDKWNPGDIWATTYQPRNKPLNEFANSWGELNNKVAEEAAMLQGFNLVRLLGISLKKIGKGLEAKVTEFNKPNVKKSEIKYQSYTWGRKNDFFSSKDLYVKCDKGEIQFRNFNKTSMWAGAITGANAYGGKIGGGNIDFYVKQVYGKLKSVYSNSKSYNAKAEKPLYSKLTKDFINKNGEVVENFYNQYVKYSKNPVNQKDFYKEVMIAEKRNSGFISSKFLNMQLVDILESGTRKQRDELMTLIFLYASSNIDQSSYFIKVS